MVEQDLLINRMEKTAIGISVNALGAALQHICGLFGGYLFSGGSSFQLRERCLMVAEDEI